MGILDMAIGTAAGAVRLGMGLAGGAIGALRGGGGDDDAPAAPRTRLGDAELAAEVRSVLFRGMRGTETSGIDVAVTDGVVFLRGTARNPQQIRTLEARARAIPDLEEVHVLLDLPPSREPAVASGGS